MSAQGKVGGGKVSLPPEVCRPLRARYRSEPWDFFPQRYSHNSEQGDVTRYLATIDIAGNAQKGGAIELLFETSIMGQSNRWVVSKAA